MTKQEILQAMAKQFQPEQFYSLSHPLVSALQKEFNRGKFLYVVESVYVYDNDDELVIEVGVRVYEDSDDAVGSDYVLSYDINGQAIL